ncbi:MAG: hypothetical protein HYS13_18415 [Planctomycetia bacterium]|nr:hypothetical protein [Planctomycetia bacterium]
MSRLLATLALTVLAGPVLGLGGCCLCAHPCDECGCVLGEEHYGCVRKASAFSDDPLGGVIYESAPGETIPAGPSEPEVSPGPTNGRPAPPPPPSSTTRKKGGTRSALVPR